MARPWSTAVTGVAPDQRNEPGPPIHPARLCPGPASHRCAAGHRHPQPRHRALTGANAWQFAFQVGSTNLTRTAKLKPCLLQPSLSTVQSFRVLFRPTSLCPLDQIILPGPADSRKLRSIRTGHNDVVLSSRCPHEGHVVAIR
jgi:hypothetical protein